MHRTTDLLTAVDVLKAVVPSKSPLPALGYISLSNGRAMATDLRNFLSLDVPYAGTPVLLEAKALAGLKVPKGARLGLTPTEGYCLISAGSFEVKLPTIDPDSHPEAPGLGAPIATARVKSGAFVSALLRCENFLSQDETRYALQGVHIYPVGGQLRLEATDGHRAYVTHVDHQAFEWHQEVLASLTNSQPIAADDQEEESAGEMAEVKTDLRRTCGILNSEAVKVLMQLHKKGVLGTFSTLEIAVHPTHLDFKADGVRLVSVVIDAVFPNLAFAIPTLPGLPLCVPRAEVADALKMALATIPKTSKNGVRTVTVTARGNSFNLAVSNDHGLRTSQSVLLRPALPGDGIVQICFNADYLHDALSLYPTRTVTLELGIQARSKDEDGKEKTELNLKFSSSPVRVRWDQAPSDVLVLMPYRREKHELRAAGGVEYAEGLLGEFQEVVEDAKRQDLLRQFATGAAVEDQQPLRDMLTERLSKLRQDCAPAKELLKAMARIEILKRLAARMASAPAGLLPLEEEADLAASEELKESGLKYVEKLERAEARVAKAQEKLNPIDAYIKAALAAAPQPFDLDESQAA